MILKYPSKPWKIYSSLNFSIENLGKNHTYSILLLLGSFAKIDLLQEMGIICSKHSFDTWKIFIGFFFIMIAEYLTDHHLSETIHFALPSNSDLILMQMLVNHSQQSTFKALNA